MNKTAFILIFWIISLSVSAQESTSQVGQIPVGHEKIENSHASSRLPLGYFIEISGGYTKFGHYDVLLPSLSLGVILNHRWTLGLKGDFIGNAEGLEFDDVYFDSRSNVMRGANRPYRELSLYS